jgi:hypothetical protein
MKIYVQLSLHFSKARIDLGKASAVYYYYVHDFDFFLHIRRTYVSIEYHLLGSCHGIFQSYMYLDLDYFL